MGLRTASRGAVRARISILFATCAVEIQIFWPRRYIVARLRARAVVAIFAVFESGVRLGDGEAGLLLAANQRRQPALLLFVRCRKRPPDCSPKMFMCTADAPEKPAPDSAIACIISAASVMPSPAPPYACGMAMPSQPSAAMAV